MKHQRRSGLRVKEAFAGFGFALFALTLVFPKWIEAATGLEPDAGSGALELVVAAVLLLVAVASALLALRDHCRPALASRSTASSLRSGRFPVPLRL